MRARFTSPTRSRAVRSVVALGLLAGPAVLAGASLSPAAAAPAPQPSIRLYNAKPDNEVTRPKGQPAFVPLPVYVTPVGGTFDLRVRRADYFSDVVVTQAVAETDGSTTEYSLPHMDTKNWRGLGAFSTITITDPHGNVTSGGTPTFCPDNWEAQRLDPDSVDTPTFPEFCDGAPFTLGSVWGIDEGWGSPVASRGGLVLDGPKGDWTVTVAIRNKFVNAFGIDPADATATLTYHVANGPGPVCRGCKATGPAPKSATPAAAGRLPNVPTVKAAPPSADLPDLRPLPSFAISVEHRRHGDFLAFASTVWVGGDSRMDIEGFRKPGEDIMDAYQYFYDGDQVVNKALVGTLEFDRRRGHNHWHLDKFAQYRLVDSDKQHVRLSKKQSFCLAPTDPVDLSIEGAARRQFGEDLGSACGGDEAVWIRETLPLGWGDTYYQSRGGQDFNITDVPNGTYYVSVEANPTRELFETDDTNNTSLRKVILKGKPGDRRVCVPAVGVIPAEGICGGANG